MRRSIISIKQGRLLGRSPIRPTFSQTDCQRVLLLSGFNLLQRVSFSTHAILSCGAASIP